MRSELLAELSRLLGPRRVMADPAALLTYESDALTTHAAAPGAVVFPRSTEEVAAVVKLLARANVPLVARGAGTGLAGGAVAQHGAVIVSLTQMDQILSIDAANRRARVQPGVVNAALYAAAAPHGLTYAPDPSSQTVCTLGGNVAENAGGPHCMKYGVTVNHVTGLTVVLPDGEVVRLGGAGEPPGFDLVGLFVGSEGTFGIATEIEVKLIPQPESVATLLAIFGELEAAIGLAERFVRGGLLPAALELIDQKTIDAVESSPFAAGYPKGAGAAVVIELDGAAAAMPRLVSRAQAICLSAGASEVRVAKDDAERERLWQGRKKAYAVCARLSPDTLIQDVVLPRSKLAAVMREVYAIALRHRLTVVTAAHLGDGNIHPSILFDRRDAELVARVEQASSEMMQAVTAAGGSITGEHGVGMDKRAHLPLMFGDATLEAMCAVRGVWNPDGRLNPGKVLPVRHCREWAGPADGR